MYQIQISSNEIIPLTPKSFSELKYTERHHLQEWIAKCPSVFGEELLMIQKEFDGFDETRERLDLLALDKQGGLVLIENKLDDSGRDVVWQSLKYAAYCSSLGNEGIVRIYQEYLDKNENGGDAKERIRDFIGKGEFDELVLNAGNDQRIILVAANFRKEVTCTALWLLKHDIRLQCFKATAFARGEETFLNMEQIIPPPEAADFMIVVAEKEKEQNTAQRTLLRREGLRQEFWKLMLEGLEKAGITLYSGVSANNDHWLNAGSGFSGVPYTLVFLKSGVRVELNMARGDRTENKRIFDRLLAEKAQIESVFGLGMKWLRLEEKKACRISFEKEFDGYDPANWPEMVRWLTVHIQKLEQAFKPHLEKTNKWLKGGGLLVSSAD